MEMMLNKIVPEGLEYRHSCEGPDDMVSFRRSLLRASFLSLDNSGRCHTFSVIFCIQRIIYRTVKFDSIP